MLGIPLRGPIIPMGRIKISKKNPEKKLLYTCSKITDLYGNLQCFVLAGQFEGGGNPIARLYIHIPKTLKCHWIMTKPWIRGGIGCCWMTKKQLRPKAGDVGKGSSSFGRLPIE